MEIRDRETFLRVSFHRKCIRTRAILSGDDFTRLFLYRIYDLLSALLRIQVGETSRPAIVPGQGQCLSGLYSVRKQQRSDRLRTDPVLIIRILPDF